MPFWALDYIAGLTSKSSGDPDYLVVFMVLPEVPHFPGQCLLLTCEGLAARTLRPSCPLLEWPFGYRQFLYPLLRVSHSNSKMWQPLREGRFIHSHTKYPSFVLVQSDGNLLFLKGQQKSRKKGLSLSVEEFTQFIDPAALCLGFLA